MLVLVGRQVRVLGYEVHLEVGPVPRDRGGRDRVVGDRAAGVEVEELHLHVAFLAALELKPLAICREPHSRVVVVGERAHLDEDGVAHEQRRFSGKDRGPQNATEPSELDGPG